MCGGGEGGRYGGWGRGQRMGVWVCTGCRGRRAPNPPPLLPTEAPSPLPAGAVGRPLEPPGPGPHPRLQPRVCGSSGPLLPPLLQPALSSLPLAAWGLQAPTSPAPEPPCTAAAPRPQAQQPLCSPRPKCKRPPLTQAGRQRLLVGPHGPLDLPHGGRSARTRLGLSRPRGPRAQQASRPAQVPQVPAPPRPAAGSAPTRFPR